MHRSEAPPPATIGRYAVLSSLGDGGMGVVYLGRDPSLDRLVAIKLMRSGVQAPDFHERFAREARAVASLRHPCIVTVYEFGEHDGQPFIVMEYIAGQTVGQLIAGSPQMPLAHRLRLAEDLCRGLHHAHKAGIVHRDIKPANLMVDDEGALKILDFGIAKHGHGAMTHASALVGTPKYMAPEQIEGGTVTPLSDVFSVGLVLYELLTGRAAYDRENVFAVMQGILHGTPTPLTELVPDIDPRLVAIVAKALEKDPVQRYQDLARMGRDLRRLRLDLSPDESYIGYADLSDLPLPLPALTPPPTPAVPLDERRARFHRAMDAQDFAGAQIACEEMLAIDPESTWGLDGLELARIALVARTTARVVESPPAPPPAPEPVVGPKTIVTPRPRAPETPPPSAASVVQAAAVAVSPGGVATTTAREMFVDRVFVEAHGRYNSVGVTVSVTTHVAAVTLAAGIALATQRTPPPPADPMPIFIESVPAAPPPISAPAPPTPRPPSPTPPQTAMPTPVEPSPIVASEPSPELPRETDLRASVEVEPTIDTTGPAAPPPPAGISETPVTDFDQRAVVLKRVLPKVPAGAGGVVQVAITVRSNGTVARVRLLTDTPYADAVLQAAEQYEFRPAQRRGRPVPVEVVVQFNLSTVR